jgi:hypothetical protein
MGRVETALSQRAKSIPGVDDIEHDSIWVSRRVRNPNFTTGTIKLAGAHLPPTYPRTKE